MRDVSQKSSSEWRSGQVLVQLSSRKLPSMLAEPGNSAGNPQPSKDWVRSAVQLELPLLNRILRGKVKTA